MLEKFLEQLIRDIENTKRNRNIKSSIVAETLYKIAIYLKRGEDVNKLFRKLDFYTKTEWNSVKYAENIYKNFQRILKKEAIIKILIHSRRIGKFI